MTSFRALQDFYQLIYDLIVQLIIDAFKLKIQIKSVYYFRYILKKMWGNMIIKEKHEGNHNAGWGQPETGGTWGAASGWGTANTGGNGGSGGWGQPQPATNNTGGWGQPQPATNNTGGWGQPQPATNNTGGWGQPPPANNTGGWGQPPPANNTGGWGSGTAGFTQGGIGQVFGNNLQGLNWIKHQQNNNQFAIVNQNEFDVLKYIQKQVIQVQESSSKKKLQELKQKGQKFIDDRFPPNNSSLSGEWGPIANWKEIKWFKVTDKLPNAKIFVDKPQPQDIKQGYLGDCYFLAGIAALAERPDRIYNLFLQTQRNNEAYYQVKMLFKGKWMTIDMDEFVPYLYDSPAFSKATSNQLWVVLLQKAWAKMYSSYKRIEAGYPEEPLHDLTGAPIKQIFLKKGQNNKEQQWQYLLKASQLQYSMVCSSNAGSDTNKSQSGVVQGHAYTILSAVELNFQGQMLRLLRLRNPWGKGQFKGAWSDDDPNWNYIDQNEKQRIGFSKGDDGIFFIPFDVFWGEFRSVTIAQINDDASYLYKSHKDKNKQGCYFKLDIKKEGTYSLQIDKTPERFFEDARQNDYNYPRATVELGLMAGGGIQKIQGFANESRTTQQKYNMKAGVYIVKILINFDPNWEKDFDVNFAVYAQYPCIITYANNQEASSFAGKAVNWHPQEENTGCDGWNQLAGYGWDKNNNNGGNNNTGGWGQPQQQQQQQQSNQGWGNTSSNNNGGWGQQPTSGGQGGWGQQQPTSGGQGGWGQQPTSSGQGGQGGWGQQPGNNQGGWGNSNNQPPSNNQGGWGQQNNNNGW